MDIDLQIWIYVFAGHPVVALMKRNNFLFSFYIDQFDKNSFTADKRGTSNLGTTNMKTELHFKSFSLHLFTTKTEMDENCRTTIVEYIHKNLTNIPSMTRKYSENG